MNVHSGKHWVLCVSLSGNNFDVHDPGFNTNQYTQADVVRGAAFRKSGESEEITQEELEEIIKNFPSEVIEVNEKMEVIED